MLSVLIGDLSTRRKGVNDTMSENEHKIAGYYFADTHAFKEAKREAETVEYIRANTDLNNMNKTLKLYHKLVERNTLKTVIGYEFLKELKLRIIAGGIITEDSLPPIKIEREEKEIRAYSGEIDHDAEQRHLEMIENYRMKLRNSIIVSAFLLVIILAMIVISIFSDRSKFVNNENQILDKYSAWEEQLDAREKALDDREKALED